MRSKGPTLGGRTRRTVVIFACLLLVYFAVTWFVLARRTLAIDVELPLDVFFRIDNSHNLTLFRNQIRSQPSRQRWTMDWFRIPFSTLVAMIAM
jgi:hypothetical protein